MRDEPRILIDRYPPLLASFEDGNFSGRFRELFRDAKHIHIATGYISATSLNQMVNDLESNALLSDSALESFSLVIGMHKFEGMTLSQKKAASDLKDKLNSLQLGEIYVQQDFPFHGKLYGFTFTDGSAISIVGSSNFSALTKQSPQMEVDVEISGQQAKNIIFLIAEMIDKTTKVFIPEDIKTIEMNYAFMKSLPNVEEVSPIEVATANLWEDALRFEIPINAAPRSNLNPSFGKGRVQKKTQAEKKRDWFEVELVVPVKIRELDGYPWNAEFWVITDDGLRFKCKTSGTRSKNFSSAGSLKTLGHWIKGRMIDAGVISLGEMVTGESISKYGRDSLTLIKKQNSDDWLLDFSVVHK